MGLALTFALIAWGCAAADPPSLGSEGVGAENISESAERSPSSEESAGGASAEGPAHGRGRGHQRMGPRRAKP